MALGLVLHSTMLGIVQTNSCCATYMNLPNIAIFTITVGQVSSQWTQAATTITTRGLHLTLQATAVEHVYYQVHYLNMKPAVINTITSSGWSSDVGRPKKQ